MAEKIIYVDVSYHSAVVVCTLCNRQWGAVDKEEGYRMAKAHRFLHMQERQEQAVNDTCQEPGCTKKAHYKKYGPQCANHYQRSRREDIT